MGEFINRYNNYNCIRKNDTENIKKLSHYTSNIRAVLNICDGEYRATDIRDFGDKHEGKLILQRINEIIADLGQFTGKQKNSNVDWQFGCNGRIMQGRMGIILFLTKGSL